MKWLADFMKSVHLDFDPSMRLGNMETGTTTTSGASAPHKEPPHIEVVLDRYSRFRHLLGTFMVQRDMSRVWNEGLESIEWLAEWARHPRPDTTDALIRVLEGRPQENGEYLHLVTCSGSRKYPPGTSGHCCTCRPSGKLASDYWEPSKAALDAGLSVLLPIESWRERIPAADVVRRIVRAVWCRDNEK